MICPYEMGHRMSPMPREVGGRTVYLCEALRPDGPRLVRCGATVVASEARERTP